MIRSVFRPFLLVWLTAALALAQTYETQFSESKYDRSKAPSTLHGNLSVDHASGAVSFDIPLGPGIGARGLKFVPTLTGRWAPQVQERVHVLTDDSGMCYSTTLTPYNTVLHSGGFSYNIDAASLNIPYPGAPPGPLPCYSAPENSEMSESYMTHDGHGSKLNINAPVQYSGSNISDLLAGFDFKTSESWEVSTVIHNNGDRSDSAARKMIVQAQDGAWVIGLAHPTNSKTILVETVLVSNTPKGSSTPTQWQAIPGRILVVRGDLAYEYGFLQSEYTGRTADPLANTEQPGLYTRKYLQNIRYGLVSIRNRAGDKIIFSHTKAEWFVPGATAPSASVTYQGVYTNSDVNPIFEVEITNQSPNMSFDLLGRNYSYSADNPSESAGVASRGMPMNDFQVSSVLETVTKEKVQLTYFSGPVENAWPTPALPPEQVGYERYYYVNALSNVSYSNGHSIGLAWESYEYLREIDGGPGHWLRAYNEYFGQSGPQSFRCWFWGVSRVTETDQAIEGSPARITTHKRVVPKPSFLKDGNGWASNTFYDAVTLPDGSSQLYIFASPQKTSEQSFSMESRTQLSAYMKHIPIEIRHYPGGNYGDVMSDIPSYDPNNNSGKPPVGRSLSKAKKIETFDHFTFVDELNPGGNLHNGIVPKPMRHRVWDLRDMVLTTDESRVWDEVGRGWTKNHRLVQPFTNLDDALPEWVQPSGDASYTAPPLGRYDRTTSTYLTDPVFLNLGVYARKTQEEKWVSDLSLGADSAVSGSWSAPIRTWDFDSTAPFFARLKTFSEAKGGLTRTISFGYVPGAPITAECTVPQSVSATVTGTSGNAGASYGYNPRGILDRITPFGMPVPLKQDTDALGFVTRQSDFNDLQTAYSYDSLGRLIQIAPPGVSAINYSITNDKRGVKVTRNGTSQSATDMFNAFGEKVLESRISINSAEPNREYTYNAKQELASQSVWGSGNSRANTRYLYDEYHRPVTVTDPNGVVTSYTYPTLGKTVAVGGLPPTHFFFDVVGRLYKVVDALNQTTTYAYDPQGRVTSVTQFANSGQTQNRNWVYDSLGRLVVLDQPESGVTYFNAFEAHGGAGLTVYGLPRGWRPSNPNTADSSAVSVANVKAISRDFYGHGQVFNERSSDGSVDQTFWYGEPGRGAGIGKLTTAKNNTRNVLRELNYGVTNGAIIELKYTMDGQLPWTQGLTWRSADGALESRTYPDGKVQVLIYNNDCMSQPTGAIFTGVNPTTLSYHQDHWGMDGLTFGDMATTTFMYDPDQIRLKSMSHFGPSIPMKTWTYSYDNSNRLRNDSEDYYDYDDLSRLRSAYVQDPMGSLGLFQSFSYDSFGNRISSNTSTVTNWPSRTALPASPTSYGGLRAGLDKVTVNMSFNATHPALVERNQLPEITSSGAGTGATYDAQGNLTGIYKAIGATAQAIALTYDALGRVRTMSDAAKNTVEVYTYDDQGLRVMTEVYQGDVLPQNLQKKQYRIYNEARQMVAEYDLVLE